MKVTFIFDHQGILPAQTLKLPHAPRQGEFVLDPEGGTREILAVVYRTGPGAQNHELAVAVYTSKPLPHTQVIGRRGRLSSNGS